MATKNTEEVKEERVEIMVPRGNDKDDPNVFVSVNGVNYLLPKGKKVSVPKIIADEYYRAEAAKNAQAERAAALADKANTPM